MSRSGSDPEEPHPLEDQLTCALHLMCPAGVARPDLEDTRRSSAVVALATAGPTATFQAKVVLSLDAGCRRMCSASAPNANFCTGKHNPR